MEHGEVRGSWRVFSLLYLAILSAIVWDSHPWQCDHGIMLQHPQKLWSPFACALHHVWRVLVTQLACVCDNEAAGARGQRL